MRLLGESKAADHFFGNKKGKKSNDADLLWPEVKERFDLGLELRRPYEQRWLLNLAFLAGRQYVMFNSSAHTIQQLKTNKSTRRTVDNILLPRWRRQVADLIRTDPVMSVVPNTNEEEDIKAAKLADKVLKHLWRVLGMKKKVRLMASWIYSIGGVFLDDRWNTKLGPVSIDEDGNVVYLGDVDVGVWSHFDIVVPATSMGDVDLHSFPWIVKSKWRDLSWIKSKYKRGFEVTPEDKPSRIIGADLISSYSTPIAGKVPGSLVHDCYIQPCSDFPKGKFITASNGIVLQTVDYPYNDYNLEYFKDIDIPGVFWGKSTVDVAMSQQIRWNRVNSSIDTYNEKAVKGKLLAPKRSKLEIVPDDKHGEVVFYSPVMGHKPDFISLKPLPPTLIQSLNTTYGSIQNLFSQHEISMGTNKSDIRSGDMVGMLREQDAYGAIPSMAVFEESLEAVMRRVLKRIQTGYTQERMIKIVGRDKDYEVIAFKGADLRDNTDVTVKRQSSLPESRVEREQQIMGRYQAGLYGDPMDPEVRRHVMNMLDDAVVEDIYSDTRLDEVYARFENGVLANAEVEFMLVNPYDNHAIHVREHNHYRKTMDYQKIKLGDQRLFMVLEQRFTKHIMRHQQFIDELEKQMIERQKEINSNE